MLGSLERRADNRECSTLFNKCVYSLMVYNLFIYFLQLVCYARLALHQQLCYNLQPIMSFLTDSTLIFSIPYLLKNSHFINSQLSDFFFYMTKPSLHCFCSCNFFGNLQFCTHAFKSSNILCSYKLLSTTMHGSILFYFFHCFTLKDLHSVTLFSEFIVQGNLQIPVLFAVM